MCFIFYFSLQGYSRAYQLQQVLPFLRKAVISVCEESYSFWEVVTPNVRV